MSVYFQINAAERSLRKNRLESFSHNLVVEEAIRRCPRGDSTNSKSLGKQNANQRDVSKSKSGF